MLTYTQFQIVYDIYYNLYKFLYLLYFINQELRAILNNLFYTQVQIEGM
jgi:hypothetical protein